MSMSLRFVGPPRRGRAAKVRRVRSVRRGRARVVPSRARTSVVRCPRPRERRRPEGSSGLRAVLRVCRSGTAGHSHEDVARHTHLARHSSQVDEAARDQVHPRTHGLNRSNGAATAGQQVQQADASARIPVVANDSRLSDRQATEDRARQVAQPGHDDAHAPQARRPRSTRRRRPGDDRVGHLLRRHRERRRLEVRRHRGADEAQVGRRARVRRCPRASRPDRSRARRARPWWSRRRSCCAAPAPPRRWRAPRAHRAPAPAAGVPTRRQTETPPT